MDTMTLNAVINLSRHTHEAEVRDARLRAHVLDLY